VIAYEPVTYWRTRGETFAAQELALVDILRDMGFASVLDVGCGTGRIGGLIRGIRPDATYTGIDISPAVLKSASARLPAGEFHETTLAAFRPGRKWDLVIASEVLMHIPSADVSAAAQKLRSLAERWVLTIDYVGERALASHNFAHPYRLLFPEAEVTRVGEQAIHVVPV
jgi:trans-aconitate methyltransferase